MKFSFPSSLLLALPLAAALFVGCKKDDETLVATTSSFSIELENVVGTSPLVLSTNTYAKADGQSFKVTKLKYLLSNVKLLKADGTAYAVPESYYLVDISKDATTHFVIPNVPIAEYTGMSFLVGVDAARNSAGAQTGALDVNNDMYWGWAQGYIFMKMEGTTTAYTGQGGALGSLVFHVGGSANAATITPSFGGDKLVIKNGHIPEVHMSVNLLKMFEGPRPINFTTTNNVMDVAGASPLVANYSNAAAGMFSIEHIHPN